MNRGQQTQLSRSQLEHRLRTASAWYEWAEPPNLAAASALQDAADAVANGTISLEAAWATLVAWRAFAGIETAVGDGPELVAVATTEEGVQRGILAHMRSMIARATSTEKRLHLTKLLEEQAKIFGSGVKRD